MRRIYLAVCLVSFMFSGCENNEYFQQYPIVQNSQNDASALDAENVATTPPQTALIPMSCVFDKDGFGIRCFGTIAGGKGESETGPGWYGSSVYGHGLSGYSLHYNGVFGRGGAAGVRGDCVADEPCIFATGSKRSLIRMQHLGWPSWDIQTSHDLTDSGLVISWNNSEMLRLSKTGQLALPNNVWTDQTTVPCTVGVSCDCPPHMAVTGRLEAFSAEFNSVVTKEIHCKGNGT